MKDGLESDQLGAAVASIRAGRTEEGQKVLEQLLAHNQTHLDAWWWYVETWPTVALRIEALRLCLRYNPGNEEATKLLARLSGSPKPVGHRVIAPPPVILSSRPANQKSSPKVAKPRSAAHWNVLTLVAFVVLGGGAVCICFIIGIVYGPLLGVASQVPETGQQELAPHSAVVTYDPFAGSGVRDTRSVWVLVSAQPGLSRSDALAIGQYYDAQYPAARFFYAVIVCDSAYATELAITTLKDEDYNPYVMYEFLHWREDSRHPEPEFLTANEITYGGTQCGH